MQLVLHPGHPKCGSSTIQFALYSNIDQLAEQGVFIPNRRFEFPADGRAYRERLGNPVRWSGDDPLSPGSAGSPQQGRRVISGGRADDDWIALEVQASYSEGS